jgi:vacuolar-type H+-ATPase subunit I/STV1
MTTKLHDIIEKLMLEQSSANHVVWGAIVCAVASLVLGMLGGFLVTLAVAFVKEAIIDDFTDPLDIVFTLVGAALVCLGAVADNLHPFIGGVQP